MQTIKITSRTVFIFLTLTGLTVYVNSFSVPFHYDDFHFLREQLCIKSFPLFFDWITHSYATILVNRAFLLFTFTFNYTINGLDTFGYHIVNLSIHISTAYIFYLFLSQYVDTEKDDRYHVKAILAATIFLVHPVATESVTYISSRSSGLSTLLILLTMLFFARATRSTFSPGIYFLSFVCFFLGLTTKQTVIVTPVLLLMFDYYFIPDHDGKFIARIKYHLPFWAVIGVGAVLFAAYITRPEMYDRPWLTHILTESKVFVEYLRIMVIPSGLTIDHYIKESVSFDRPAIFSIAMTAGVLSLAVLLNKKNKVLSFSLFWIFINLAPFFVVKLSDYMAERWAYAALLGFALGASELLFAVTRRYPRIGISAMLAIVLLWGTLTHLRNTVFQDPITLWAEAAHASPGKTRPYTNLCGAYLERGDVRKAIEMCSTAIEKGGDDDETFINLSSAYFYNHDLKKAEDLLLSKARTRTNAAYHYNLGIIYSRGKKYREAIREYRQVLSKKPHSLAAFTSIGECYLLFGDKEKATEYYRLATKEIPQSGEDYLLLAESYAQLGERERVAENFSNALRTEPLNINIRNAIANLYMENKKYDEAYRHFSIMAKIAPHAAISYIGMGNAMLGKGDLKEAGKQYTRALGLLPQDSPDRSYVLKLLEKAGA